MKPDSIGTFRLRFRREGKCVNAYLCYPAPIEESVLMASIADGLLSHPDTFEDFAQFVKRALSRGGFEFGEAEA